MVPGKRMNDLELTLTDKKEYTGQYYSEELRATYRVYLEDNQLMLRVGYTGPVHLIPSREDVFEGGFTFKFRRDKNGQVTGLVMEAGRVRGLKFEKLRPADAGPGKEVG